MRWRAPVREPLPRADRSGDGRGGELDIDGRSGIRAKISFIARFILGFDAWATDHVGFFVEGGGHAASEDNGDGVGLFTVGGQYRI